MRSYIILAILGILLMVFYTVLPPFFTSTLKLIYILIVIGVFGMMLVKAGE